MANPWAIPGTWMQIGVWQDDASSGTQPPALPGVVLVPVTLTMVSSSSGNVGATVYGTTDILQIPRIQPRGPYGQEMFIALNTRSGFRIFGFRMVTEFVQGQIIERLDTLIAIDPVEFGSGGQSGDVLGRIMSPEQPSGRATISNMDGRWSKLWSNEVLLGQPMGWFMYLGAPPLVTIFVGGIERMQLSKYEIVLEYGWGS